MTDRAVIETAGLTKRYDDVEALRGLDLRVPSGSIFGFLGRNGAGKTTTIKVLLGMARPTSGDARVFGLSPAEPRSGVEIRRRCAFVSDEKDLYDYMTVGEIDRLHAIVLPALERRARTEISAQVRAAARPRDQGPVARHAHQARVAAGALPRRRAAGSRRADFGTGSGDGGGRAPGTGRSRHRPRVNDLLLVAPTFGSRADCRSRGDYRSRPDGRVRRARRPARAVPAHPAGVRGRCARRSRSTRLACIACSGAGA